MKVNDILLLDIDKKYEKHAVVSTEKLRDGDLWLRAGVRQAFIVFPSTNQMATILREDNSNTWIVASLFNISSNPSVLNRWTETPREWVFYKKIQINKVYAKELE